MAIQPAGRGPQLIAVYSFFVAFTTVTIALRTYCRISLVKKFALDDWLAVIAWVLFVLFTAFAITGAFHGTGQHAADIKPPTEIPVGLMWWWACEPVYVLANMAIKGSIGVMLLRLTIDKTHRIIIWVTIVITEIYGAFFFFLFLLQCIPSAYFWTQYTGGAGTCIDPTITVKATYAYSAVTCVGDWIFAILPFFLVWKLQMNPRTKLVVAMILALGAIASTATIVRIPYISSYSNKADFLYATTDVAIWSCCETGLAIAAASIATLRPLFRSFLSHSKLFGASTSPHRKTYPWTGSAAHGQGYVRSQSRGGVEELGMRDDIGKTAVTHVALEDCGNTVDSGSNSSETRLADGSKSGEDLKGKDEWDGRDKKMTFGRGNERGRP